MANDNFLWPANTGGGVTSLNGLTGALTLVGGTGITITPLGGNITISTSALLTAITSINSDTTSAQLIVAASTGTDFTVTTATGTTTLALPIASATNTGKLSSTDWSTFNNKQSALTLGNLTDVGTDGIVITGGTGAVIGSGTSLAQHVADTTHNGYLSSTDWNTFNNKQAIITIGALDAQAANAAGLALVANVLSTQSADASHPGLVNTSTQTFSGSKTFTGLVQVANTIQASGSSSPASGAGVELSYQSGVNTARVLGFDRGVANARIPIQIDGSTASITTNNTAALAIDASQNVTISTLAGSGTRFVTASAAGILSTGTAAIIPSEITLTSNHIIVGSAGVGADVAMSGDATISSTGALTLTTVNGNVGSFGSSTAIPTFTVNAKGLLTAVGTATVTAANISTTAVSTNASFFPLFVASSSNSNQVVDLGTGLTFNPSTNNLSTTTFTGALSGNATTATTSTNFSGSLAGDITGNQGVTVVSKIAGTTVSGTTGTTNVVFSASPTLTGTVNCANISATGQILTSLNSGTAISQSGASAVNSFAGITTFTSTAQFTGSNSPSSGVGIELSNQSGTGRVLAFDRGGAARIPLLLDGSTTTIDSGGVNAIIVDANQNMNTQAGVANKNYDTSTATSGTITASANKPGLVINSAGGTTLTIKLPSSPIDGQIYWVSSVGAFTTVTWQDNGGTAGNVIGGQAALGGTNRGQTFVYSLALTKWLATS